ncbi:hypothetical protein R1sor_002339 [Riccia sorocarpa]|uniref:RING-type domain-containing protein n=1 Tax=Riccia sorocarpa TaxID=122646 RepID=A0ABD3GYI4_9MARC
MGNGPSREEQLYQAVTQSNHQAVKTLRRDGASLEWVDKEGRTPLILACTRGDLYDMVITLLNEGARLDAYRPGNHGGFPLHHAAKRGLDKTVLLLLSRGADPLAINDDGLTPLDMARQRNHVSVVRIIEERICLFSGMMRELSGLGFLESLAPQLFTKKVWVVVLPTESDPRRPSRNELVIYQSPKVRLWNGGVNSQLPSACKVAIPRTVISLAKAEIEEPKFSLADPQLVITATDKNAKVKFKFLSENEGDKAQLDRLYKACARGIRLTAGASTAQPGVPSQVALQGLQALIRPTGAQPSTADNQLALQAPPATGATPVPPVRVPPPPPPPPAGPGTPFVPGPPPPPPHWPQSQAGKGNPSTSAPPPPPPNGKGKPGKNARPSSPNQDSPMSEEMALALAIDASIRTASAEGVPMSPSAKPSSSWDSGRSSYGPSDGRKGSGSGAEYNGWGDGAEQSSSYGGWVPGSSAGAGPSRIRNSSDASSSASDSRPGSSKEANLRVSPNQSSTDVTVPSAPPLAPSAPPLPLLEGPISYPSVDTTPVDLDYSNSLALVEVPPEPKKPEEKATASQCVVCWDAPAEGVCIPCGHLAGCMSCLTEIKSKDWGCPVCRAGIQQVMKVYAV